MANNARLTQQVAEAVGDVTAAARLTQQVAEAVGDVTPEARVTQVIVEVLSTEFVPLVDPEMVNLDFRNRLWTAVAYEN